MDFYMNDKREYSSIIEKWVIEFKDTMYEDHEIGNDTGDHAPGIKIIFDGYGEREDGSEDTSMESYAVFIHETSLEASKFPKHETTPFGIIHRPKEECCIYCWYDVGAEEVTVIPFEDNNSTEMDPKKVTQLIFDIHDKYYT